MLELGQQIFIGFLIVSDGLAIYGLVTGKSKVHDCSDHEH